MVYNEIFNAVFLVSNAYASLTMKQCVHLTSVRTKIQPRMPNKKCWYIQDVE